MNDSFIYLRMNMPYNVTVEELEVRVERLEEDMFLVQNDVNELQYSVQETIETVRHFFMLHSCKIKIDHDKVKKNNKGNRSFRMYNATTSDLKPFQSDFLQ